MEEVHRVRASDGQSLALIEVRPASARPTRNDPAFLLLHGFAQNRLGYLPERHTDYIFAIVAEEWGFVGSTLVLGLYALLLSRIGRAGLLARDRLGAMICLGTFLFISAHLIVNVGMVVGLVPTIGIPLMLLSFGGSALVATFAMLGLTLSVGVHRSAR